MRLRKQGIALVTALLMTALLLVFVAALVTGLRQSGFLTRAYQDEATALGVAEAGVYHTLAKLEEDVSWTDGFNEKAMLKGEGHYTVTFNPDPGSGPVSAQESVNNLMGTAAVNGPRGLGTVAPHSAEIVVDSLVGTRSRRLTVVIKKAPPPTDASIASTRRVRIHGDSVISGITSLEDPQEIPSGIHSNMGGTPGSVILWTADPGDTVSVSGTVSSVASGAGSIDFSDSDGVATLAGSPATDPGADEIPIPDIDIQSRIDGKSSSPAPTTSPGITTLPSGDYYASGDFSYSGDLKLEDANLYVNGDLDLRGALSGNGSVFVAGETEVKGSVEIATTNDQNVALFSQGSVKLTGYNGTQYMEDIIAGGDAQFASDYAAAETAYTALRANLDMAGYPFPASVREEMDAIRRVLGAAGSGPTFAGLSPAVLTSMRQNLRDNYPASSSRDFVIRKLNSQIRFFWGRLEPYGAEPPAPPDVIWDDWVSGAHRRFAMFDVFIDDNTMRFSELAKQLEVYIDQVNWDSPGSSYFQGMVYTKGFLYAGNEITVIGALMTHGDDSLPGETIDGVALEPGDILLASRSTLTYNREYFDGTGSGGGGLLSIVTWIGR